MAVRVIGRFSYPEFSDKGFTDVVDVNDYPRFRNPWVLRDVGLSELEPFVGEPVFDLVHEDGTVFGRYYEKSGNFWLLANFYETLREDPELIIDVRNTLAGKLLTCEHSADVECHADVLFDVANSKSFAKYETFAQ